MTATRRGYMGLFHLPKTQALPPVLPWASRHSTYRQQLFTRHQKRGLHLTSTMSSGKKADWSPDQYLLFKQARGRAIDDLIAYLGRSLPAPPSRIIDLGCGPGNSTKSLLAQFPNANVSGLDSSPAMIAAAQRALPNLKFTLADLSSYDPPVSSEEPTLLFSNAVFHWLRRDHRIPTISRLLRSLEPNGVLAFQVPDNFDEPSHRAMRETAYSAEFASYFSGANGKPELDPIESAAEYYDALTRDAAHVEIWRTEYQHVLTDHGEIVEWVRGTGLMPFLDRLPEEDDGPDGGEVRKQFLNEYRKRLEKSYGILKDGKVMLTYPRLFVVAFRA